MKTVRIEGPSGEEKNAPLSLLVLVPHRDVRLPLRAWSASLFAAGFPGARSFPHVAPLAELSRRLSGAELKCLARSLRDFSGVCGDKFFFGPPAGAALPGSNEGYHTAGPALRLELPVNFFEICGDAVIRPFSPVILGSALVRSAGGGDTATGENGNRLPEKMPLPPEVSFRAAALANMDFRPFPHEAGLNPDSGLDGYSFEWKIGGLHWLPKH